MDYVKLSRIADSKKTVMDSYWGTSKEISFSEGDGIRITHTPETDLEPGLIAMRQSSAAKWVEIYYGTASLVNQETTDGFRVSEKATYAVYLKTWDALDELIECSNFDDAFDKAWDLAHSIFAEWNTIADSKKCKKDCNEKDDLKDSEVEDSKTKTKMKFKQVVKDSKSFKSKMRSLRVSDSYKNLKKRIKDDLAETESTDEVIEVVSNYLDKEPVEQVVPAAIEVIGEAYDALQSKVDELLDGAKGSDVDEVDKDDLDKEIQDALRRRRVRAARIRDARSRYLRSKSRR